MYSGHDFRHRYLPSSHIRPGISGCSAGGPWDGWSESGSRLCSPCWESHGPEDPSSSLNLRRPLRRTAYGSLGSTASGVRAPIRSSWCGFRGSAGIRQKTWKPWSGSRNRSYVRSFQDIQKPASEGIATSIRKQASEYPRCSRNGILRCRPGNTIVYPSYFIRRKNSDTTKYKGHGRRWFYDDKLEGSCQPEYFLSIEKAGLSIWETGSRLLHLPVMIQSCFGRKSKNRVQIEFKCFSQLFPKFPGKRMEWGHRFVISGNPRNQWTRGNSFLEIIISKL